MFTIFKTISNVIFKVAVFGQFIWFQDGISLSRYLLEKQLQRRENVGKRSLQSACNTVLIHLRKERRRIKIRQVESQTAIYPTLGKSQPEKQEFPSQTCPIEESSAHQNGPILVSLPCSITGWEYPRETLPHCRHVDPEWWQWKVSVTMLSTAEVWGVFLCLSWFWTLPATLNEVLNYLTECEDTL